MCSGLIGKGVCRIIPQSEVFHLKGLPVLNGMFGVSKDEFVKSGGSAVNNEPSASEQVVPKPGSGRVHPTVHSRPCGSGLGTGRVPRDELRGSLRTGSG